jgi:hypothetical protein
MFKTGIERRIGRRRKVSNKQKQQKTTKYLYHGFPKNRGININAL